jgi:hypothetical protein
MTTHFKKMLHSGSISLEKHTKNLRLAGFELVSLQWEMPGYIKGNAIHVNRSWRPIGFPDVEAPTFS